MYVIQKSGTGCAMGPQKPGTTLPTKKGLKVERQAKKKVVEVATEREEDLMR